MDKCEKTKMIRMLKYLYILSIVVGALMFIFSNLVPKVNAQNNDVRIGLDNVQELVELWSVDNAHENGLTSAIFHPTLPSVLTSSFGNEGIKYWEIYENEAKFEFDEHRGDVTSLAISSDGSQILSTGVDNTVVLWDAKSEFDQLPVLNKRLIGHTQYVWSVAFWENEKQAISGSSDRTVILWDLDSGSPSVPPITGHIGDIFSVAARPNNMQAVSGGCGIYVGDKTRSNGLACVAGAVYLLDIEIDKEIEQSEVDKEKSEPIIRSFEGHDDTVYSIVFSTDGRQLLSGSADNTLILWDAETGEIIQRFPSDECVNNNNCAAHINDVYSVSLSNDGSLALSGSADGTVIIWNVETGMSLQQIRFEGAVRTVTFNKQNTMFAVGTFARELSVWGLP